MKRNDGVYSRVMKNSSHSKAAVNRLTARYDAEARAYVDHWAPYLHPLACALVEHLPEVVASRVLDIGAGAGLLLPVLQERFPRALVAGVDRSAGMLSLAGERESVAVTDACTMGIRSGSFDVAVMAFILFHLPDTRTGLEEARRVLRPGGTVAVSTWSGDVASPVVDIWNEELDAHGAIAVEDLNRLAHHDLMDSTEKVEALLTSAGFGSARAIEKEFTHVTDSDEFIRLRTRVGANKERFETLDESARDRFVGVVRERLSKLSTDDLGVRMGVILCTALA